MKGLNNLNKLKSLNLDNNLIEKIDNIKDLKCLTYLDL